MGSRNIYTAEEWLNENENNIGSRYEKMFIENVVARLRDFSFSSLSTQVEFYDVDGGRRYCDFTITEGESVRIAIEIDGYDKRGVGSGMSHEEFVDWQRRHAALVCQGWDVVRFANRDVRDHPRRCALILASLLEQSRNKAKLDKRIEGSALETKSWSNRYSKTRKSRRIILSIVMFALLFCFFVYFLFNVSSTKIFSDMKVMIDSHFNHGLWEEGCDGSLHWKDGVNHLGEMVSVSGGVADIVSRPDVNGHPTWINLGNKFPHEERLDIVIWGEDADNFSSFLSSVRVGDMLCVRGVVESYRGIPQIVFEGEWGLE